MDLSWKLLNAFRNDALEDALVLIHELRDSPSNLESTKKGIEATAALGNVNDAIYALSILRTMDVCGLWNCRELDSVFANIMCRRFTRTLLRQMGSDIQGNRTELKLLLKFIGVVSSAGFSTGRCRIMTKLSKLLRELEPFEPLAKLCLHERYTK
jgi:hypothetical protein